MTKRILLGKALTPRLPAEGSQQDREQLNQLTLLGTSSLSEKEIENKDGEKESEEWTPREEKTFVKGSQSVFKKVVGSVQKGP